MKIERHEIGPRMSKAVVHGDTVYLAGIVADAPKGKSTAEQTKNILSQIDGFLARAGTDKSKVLSANIWITEIEDPLPDHQADDRDSRDSGPGWQPPGGRDRFPSRVDGPGEHFLERFDPGHVPARDRAPVR